MKEKPPLKSLEERLSYKFSSIELLQCALTHRSAVTRNRTYDYERLEFLGDAVLDLAISDMLINLYPQHREGELSKSRAALVNTDSLATIAQQLALSSYVVVSKSEMTHEGHKRAALLADVVESVIGAVYQDSNYDSAKKVISMLFQEHVKCVKPSDPKTDLQELVHVLGFSPPAYELQGKSGPEHDLIFRSLVLIGGESYGPGEGRTKKSSQQAAAKMALDVLRTKAKEKESKDTKNNDIEKINCKTAVLSDSTSENSVSQNVVSQNSISPKV